MKKTSATMPATTEIPVTMRLLMMRSTPFLYLFVILSNEWLKPAWKRSTKDIFLPPLASASSSFGFRKMAQRAGESVRALTAEIKMEIAIVIPNSR